MLPTDTPGDRGCVQIQRLRWRLTHASYPYAEGTVAKRRQDIRIVRYGDAIEQWRVAHVHVDDERHLIQSSTLCIERHDLHSGDSERLSHVQQERLSRSLQLTRRRSRAELHEIGSGKHSELHRRSATVIQSPSPAAHSDDAATAASSLAANLLDDPVMRNGPRRCATDQTQAFACALPGSRRPEDRPAAGRRKDQSPATSACSRTNRSISSSTGSRPRR